MSVAPVTDEDPQPGPATVWAGVVAALAKVAATYPDTDPTTLGYLIARGGLLQVNALQGPRKVAQLAYRLGDEFATMEP